MVVLVVVVVVGVVLVLVVVVVVVLLVELVCCGDGGDCVGDEWVGAALRAYAGERTLIRPAHHLLHDFGWWH